MTQPDGSQVNLSLPASGERLDQALAQALPDLSRAQIQRLIKAGHVLAAGQRVKASHRLLTALDVTLSVPPTRETDLKPEVIFIDIKYEDAHIIVVDKPAGMVVHPGPGHTAGTLVNAILSHCPEIEGIGGERRPGIVHRLDKDSSGLMVVAKHDKALRFLQQQFKERTVAKRYLALVEGSPRLGQALIDAPIGRDPRQRKKMAVVRGRSTRQREARTRYEVLTQFDDYALIACQPETGRTHQIRVHMAFIGHPLVGDRVYGRRKQPLLPKRHFLHAAGLAFVRPGDGTRLALESPLPSELQAVLDRLEAAQSYRPPGSGPLS